MAELAPARSRGSSVSSVASIELTPTNGHKYGFDPSQLHTIACQWNDCGAEFWEIEPLIDHIYTLHAFPNHPVDGSAMKKGTASYVCEWAGCLRKGKNQNSKFALMGHLRSHTGEKPFPCPKPECDKSFTRTDALQKHMRVQHGEANKKSVPAAPVKAASTKSKKRATSVDSNEGEAPPPPVVEEEREIVHTQDEIEAFTAHPELDKDYILFVLLLAKRQYMQAEQKRLKEEAEEIGWRVGELEAECETLTEMILRKEIGSVPTEGVIVESFLKEIQHESNWNPNMD